MTTINNSEATIVTFYITSKYAGGRSHRNINTLEFVEDKDILQAAEHYGYHLYPTHGEDFENGVNDWNDNQVMDAEDFKKFTKTNIGIIDLGDTVFSCEKLEDIGVEQFKILPKNYQLDYINIWYANVTKDMLQYAIDKYNVIDVFEYSETDWVTVMEDMAEEIKDAS